MPHMETTFGFFTRGQEPRRIGGRQTLRVQTVYCIAPSESSKMKPCVCQGSNESCRYCSGSGVVPDNVGVPRTRSDLEKWRPESSNDLPPRRDFPPKGASFPARVPQQSFRSGLIAFLCRCLAVPLGL